MLGREIWSFGDRVLDARNLLNMYLRCTCCVEKSVMAIFLYKVRIAARLKLVIITNLLDREGCHLSGYVSAKTEVFPEDRSRCVPASFASWRIHFHVLGIVAVKGSNIWGKGSVKVEVPANYYQARDVTVRQAMPRETV